MRILMALVLAFSSISVTNAQDLTPYERKELIVGTDTLRYRVMYPLNFDRTKKYPLVIFLHGSGERGNDNTAQLMHGAKLFSNDQARLNFPAIVIFPQCPSSSFWANTKWERIPTAPTSFRLILSGIQRNQWTLR